MAINIFFRNIKRTLLFIKQRMQPGQFLLFMCVVVSLLTGLAAVLLKLCVFHLEELFFYENKYAIFPGYKSIVPFLGIGICAIMILKIFKRNFIKGNDAIVYAMIKKRSVLPFSAQYSPLLTSSVTVGLGGSAGLESPIVASGAAIGSNCGRIAFLTQKDKTLLIGCGAAAGISTAFSAPIAGVLFSLEVLMIDLSLNALIPLLMSAIIGTLLANILLGNEILLSFDNIEAFDYARIPYYLAIGLLSGAVSVYFAKVVKWMEKKFTTLKTAVMRWFWGCLILGILIFLFPPLFGEGYLFIKGMTGTDKIVDMPFFLRSFSDNQWLMFAFACALVLLKVFATGCTMLSGGNGGSFAPSLFIGALVGFIVGKFCELAFGEVNIPMANYIVAGMAGVLSGIFYAPLTAIFLSAELTNGYPLFIPLMIVSSISYLFVRSFSPLSLEMQKVKAKTMMHDFNKDHFLLSSMRLDQFVHKQDITLEEHLPISELMQRISNTDSMNYAVVDSDNHYKGLVTLNDLKQIILSENETEWKNATAGQLMQKIKAVNIESNLADVLDRFEKSQTKVLPVIDAQNHFMGFVQEHRILELYRKEINLSVMSEL